MTLYKDLPKGDDILTANGIVKYGSMVFSCCHGDISSPYHDIAGIVYEADDFYTVLHSIIMACWMLCRGWILCLGDGRSRM
jgi:hypothetical protein